MKTRTPYNIIFLLLLIPFMALANTPVKAKHTRKKVIKKEFNVNSNATLSIDNSYGNVDVITWNENRIVFEITITTNGNDSEKVQNKLEDITVEFNATPSFVSAKTLFSKTKSKWWDWTGSSNVNMKINYIVKIPITNSVNLSNDYGAINLDKLEGRAKINCDYGKITTKELMADNNEIEFDYTSNSYFEYIKSGTINADYSGFTVAKTKDLLIEADYTNSKVEIGENVTYNCDYGSMTIDMVNNFKGEGDYLTVVIGDVYKSVHIDADYGSIKIKNMTANANNVRIDSDYVGIKIGYDPKYVFDFELDLEYADLRDQDGFEFSSKRIESSDKYYKGYYGRANSGNTVKINSDYGSVSFIKN
ncbi:hypothetical protein [Formosa algae]|uniref:Adhesin domain-containing protein n=1 Tax=Formosa algae TaxID=225843 RepID=A0A9X1CCI4_9FLAO|nr:hypothetical protein [Formosa algae]MBP1841142.1 hypothetical protein [Formosa algae]MDQ0336438.1 hypothetical protein [Formosa algae]OEI81401.1 hypothetical protein AST99_03970 [Formosa algae]PNW27936.1 hypothetical protein BKP44_10995 [Formosa algae]